MPWPFTRSTARPKLFRPALFALEDRTTPATFTVVNTDDSGTGSLRDAIDLANSTAGDDTIVFDATAFATAQTITLTTGQLSLTDATGTTTITGPAAGVTISGNNADRVFNLFPNAAAAMTRLTITGGNITEGAGVLVAAGAVLTLTDSTVTGNVSSSFGGGVYVASGGTATLTNCTVSGNNAFYGGGVYNAGTATLTNCTVSGNTATNGGGGVSDSGTATLTNTVVAGNTAPTDADLRGFVSGSNNLIGDAASSGGLTDGVAGNIVGVSGADLGLSALGFFGGPTRTFALLPGSKAIGAGTSAGAPATDQRGFARTGSIDIGAFQTQPALVVNTTFDSTNSGSPSGKLSLREAIALANASPGADAITFDPTVFAAPQTITLGGSQLRITDATGTTTITGPAAGVTVSGNDASRVFLIAASASGDLSGLTITGGNSDYGSGLYNLGTVRLTNCTVTGNSGGIRGGGILNLGTATLTNCTVTGNSSTRSGAGGLDNLGTVTLTNCTVSGNTATGGGRGGIFNRGTATLTNTIVAGNTSRGTASDIENSDTLAGSNNLIGTGGSGGLVDGVNGNIVGVANPGLSALGNFGGPVPTIALLFGSPAINAGTSTGAPATDARGKGRVGGVDIGAFESQGFTLTIAGGNNQQAAVNAAFAQPLVVGVAANDPGVPVDGISVTFTAPGSGAGATIAGSPATVTGGTASVTATANGTAGPFQVTASAPGVAGVTFDLASTAAESRANQNSQPTYAVGAGRGGPGAVTVYNADGTVNRSVSPLPDGTGARALTADVNGDGVADTVVTTGPGVRVRVAVVDGKTGAVTAFDAFEDTFTGGAFVAAGDLDGDGQAEIAVSADATGSARVSVFANTGTVLGDFFGIDDPTFRGGSRVAFGDVNGDGTPDLIVAAGTGGGPRVAVYDGKTVLGTFAGQPQRLIGDFFAFEETLRNGAYVTAGDVNADGFADLIFGGGPDGAPRVRIANGKALLDAGDFGALDNPDAASLTIGSFFAGGSAFEVFRQGVVVAAKDLDGDPFADLVAGVPGNGSTIFTYPGKTLLGTANPPTATAFDVFPDLLTGVFVG